MKKVISQAIVEAIKDYNFESAEILKSKEIELGEYQTNLALRESRNVGKAPLELAEELKSILEGTDLFETVQVKAPGFLFFKLNENFIVNEALKYMDDDFTPSIGYKGKINYEFISANPTGLLHTGHARNAIVGDAFTRIAEFAGYEVDREYYVNDAGNQINDLAISVESWMKFIKGEYTEEQLKENSHYNGREIEELARHILDEGMEMSFEELKKFSLEHFLVEIKKTLESVNIKPMDIWTSEKELFESKKVETLLNKIKETEYYYEEDGATWIRTTEFKDDKDRVLVKADGNTTYLVGDIANHATKYEKGYDKLYDLFGKDHHGYEQRVRAAMSILGHDESKLVVDFIAMVKLLKNGEEVKMSKRAGTGLPINDLVNMTDIEAFRFALLERNKEQDLVIELDKFEDKTSDNAYFQAQYAHARANTMIEKFISELGDISEEKTISYELEAKENELIKVMLDFVDRVDQSVRDSEPSIVVSYIKELGKAFNSYYNNVVVMGENDSISRDRIKLVVSFRNLIRIAFNLIGIKPKDKM